MYTFFVCPSGQVHILQDGRRVGDAPSVDKALRAIHAMAPLTGKTPPAVALLRAA